MGGSGSGMHGRQGRRAGGHNSPAAVEAMRSGMVAALAVKAARPYHCQMCGATANKGNPLEWFGELDEYGERHRRWLCGLCLTGPMVRLRLEDFMRSGVSNLGVE